MAKIQSAGTDPEFVAMSEVYSALKDIDNEAQSRILNYVAEKLKVSISKGYVVEELRSAPIEAPVEKVVGALEIEKDNVDEELEGVSPVAKRWIARNDLSPKELSKTFSLGVDEIDLIAKTVPGKSKRERTRSVFLLRGIAAYLGTGVPKFTHEQMKEACLHYDAFDATNFAVIFKGLSSEVAGSKEVGYTLTARGLASATEMLKGLS